MRTGQEQDGPGLVSVEPNSSGGKSATPSDARTSHRRSSRLPIAIPVLVYAHEQNDETSYTEGKTLSAMFMVHFSPLLRRRTLGSHCF